MNKAIGYIRVSTTEQASEGVSLEAQRAKIAAWAVANDYELVAIHEDAGITGTSMEKRAGLQAAIAATGKGMALVAYSFSRLARSTADMLEIASGLEKKGADLVSLTEKIDTTTTAAGRMVFRMLAVLSEFERTSSPSAPPPPSPTRRRRVRSTPPCRWAMPMLTASWCRSTTT